MAEEPRLPPPTDEVLEIIEDLRKEFNVAVTAYPGCGKTSMALEIARVFPWLKVLLIVYNAALKDETREKIKMYRLHNMTCHSFHACASAYMKPGCCDDELLEDALKETELRRDFDFDILCIDESQDAKDIFWRFIARICAFRRTNPRPFQLAHMGDPLQEVYGTMGADKRYLTMAHQIYPSDMGPWTQRKLTLSHRLTRQMADTVNELFLREPGAIRSVRDGPPVEFYLGDAYKTVREFANVIGKMISDGVCTAGEIMVIAPSVKKNFDTDGPAQPVVRLARYLGKHLVHVDHSEDGGVRDQIARGKILFTNQCQPKGTERNVVFVLGVDGSLIRYFSGGADATAFHTVPSTLFVAMTRSKVRMFVQVDHVKYGFLPFFDEGQFFRGSPSWNIRYVSDTEPRRMSTVAAAGKPRKYRATDLSRHINQRAAKSIQGELIWEQHVYAGWKHIRIEGVKKCERNGEEYFEQVSDIVGLAIPALMEERTTGKASTIRAFIATKRDSPLLIPHSLMLRSALTISEKTLARPVSVFKSCVLYDALKSGYFHRLRQISSYVGWMHPWQVKALLQRAGEIWSSTDGFQCEVTKTSVIRHPVHGDIKITGRVDVVCGKILWETKCISGSLSDEHRLQLLVYAYLFGPEYKYRLINLLSGECVELIYNEESVTRATLALISEKFDRLPQKTDDEFLLHTSRLWQKAIVL